MKKVTKPSDYTYNKIDDTMLKLGDIFKFSQEGELYIVEYAGRLCFMYSMVGDEQCRQRRCDKANRMVYRVNSI